MPSFIVRLDSQKHIDFSLKSPFGGESQDTAHLAFIHRFGCDNIISSGGRPGRVKRKNAKKGDDAGSDADE